MAVEAADSYEALAQIAATGEVGHDIADHRGNSHNAARNVRCSSQLEIVIMLVESLPERRLLRLARMIDSRRADSLHDPPISRGRQGAYRMFSSAA